MWSFNGIGKNVTDSDKQGDKVSNSFRPFDKNIDSVDKTTNNIEKNVRNTSQNMNNIQKNEQNTNKHERNMIKNKNNMHKNKNNGHKHVHNVHKNTNETNKHVNTMHKHPSDKDHQMNSADNHTNNMDKQTNNMDQNINKMKTYVNTVDRQTNKVAENLGHVEHDAHKIDRNPTNFNRTFRVSEKKVKDISKKMTDTAKQGAEVVKNFRVPTKKSELKLEEFLDATNKSTKITQNGMLKTLDWVYEQTINGLPGQKDIHLLAGTYVEKYGTDEAIYKLVKSQATKSATSGFITGFGGFVTMPLTTPANITSVLLFQMRMISAIAIIRGYDLRDDEVQTFIYASLVGRSVSDIAKRDGISFGQKVPTRTMKRLPATVLTKINQAVGFRLVNKFETKGLVKFGKMVPIFGGVVGGSCDVASTLTIARLTKKTFTEAGINLGDGTIIAKTETKEK